MGDTFSVFKSFATLAVANFANINSNEYFCPVRYTQSNGGIPTAYILAGYELKGQWSQILLFYSVPKNLKPLYQYSKITKTEIRTAKYWNIVAIMVKFAF